MPRKPRLLLLLLSLALLPAFVLAGRPKYQYGECWWKEYRYSEGTTLLFHFGPPQVSANEALAGDLMEKRAKEEKVGKLFSTDPGEDDSVTDEMGMDPEGYKRGPQIDPSKVSESEVQDYAHANRRYPLPHGMEKVPGGRFGEGLKCTGETGLSLNVNAPNSIELSFHIDEYPDTTQCLWSVKKDEARLLLHSDGRLEFKLKKPHGRPGTDPNRKTELTDAELEAIMQRDAEIISKEPVPRKKWVHVRVYRHPHPTPGGGPPWDARLVIDGKTVDSYLSERYNMYRFFGRRATEIILGNSSSGGQGFEGVMDEFRLLGGYRRFYTRPKMPWRDSDHKLQFGRPWFRNDSTVFYAPLGQSRKYEINRKDAPPIDLNTEMGSVSDFLAPGILGDGWLINPNVGFPRLSLKGVDAEQGSLEFWFRPVNWDDCTGYWSHTPPRHMRLTIVRLYGRDRRDGKVKQFLKARFPRAHNRERSRKPISPGHWNHVVLRWKKNNPKWAGVSYRSIGGRRHSRGTRRDPELIKHIEPLYAEFGVPDDVTVKWRQKPLVVVDEVVGYSLPLAGDEIEQAFKRWKGRVNPIKLYVDNLQFKWSLQKLEYTWKPRLPRERSASEVTLQLQKKGRDTWKDVSQEQTVPIRKGKSFAVLTRGDELPEGLYRISFVARNSDGKVVLEGSRNWNYQEEPWRGYDGGIVQEAPSPWKDIEVDGEHLITRMTEYELAENGLPEKVVADGQNLLAAPVQLMQNGETMQSGGYELVETSPTEVRWKSTFAGASADVEMRCRLEFDGMIRYELDVQPESDIQSMKFEIPLKAKHAKRYLYYPMGRGGVKTGSVPSKRTRILESRVDPVSWRAYKRARRRDSSLTWTKYRGKLISDRKAYGFFGHVDVNDMNRGLFWFCDNAAGWHQSKERSAIRLVRENDDTVTLRLNLVAEPVNYDYERPIVFGIIPHPARPMPQKYRMYGRVSAERDDKACSIFDAFRPWPKQLRPDNMDIHPLHGSWEYAESCVPMMKSAKPTGYRTMYLSLKWMSCRAGQYDGWEWRSGDSGSVSLTPSFVDYLCWEMNEWIGRDIFDAVYLDECYEWPLYNLEAGMSVRLPNGKQQPGVNNFRFRELMKRWYGIFVQHDQKPMLIAHHTHSFQYPGLVYVQAYLDGENSPIVSLKGGDWIDKTNKKRFEVIQNGQMWGMAPFYMPYISEGGFSSDKDEFPVWQWRMARQAQSQFAHYEVATVYEGQGAGVYEKYWNDLLNWTAGNPDKVPFRPYWNNEEFVQVEGQGDDTLVSFYQKPDRILLIASNRRRERRVVRIRLDAERLGLSSPLSARNLDSSFERPPGKDYHPQTEETREKTEELLESEGDLFGGGGEDETAEEILLGKEGMEKKERESLRPRMEGNVLVLPVRTRDFRMVEVK